MNNNLYDILEICLQEIENGADLEVVLARYPDFVEELRPILQASVNAKQMSVPGPSADMVRRNRAKLLQRAVEMREEKPVMKNWFPAFQRLAIAVVLLMLFFLSGTSLVRASSSTLPGDNLYSVKRSWEDVTLFFTFNTKAHETLQVEYENERLDEINKLFASGRPASVDFSGVISSQNGEDWRIANIAVRVSPQTKLPNQALMVGMAVHVVGTTGGDGTVLAEQIEVLPAGIPLPEVQDKQPEIETEQPQTTSQPDFETATQESVSETPEIEATVMPSPTVDGNLNTNNNENLNLNSNGGDTSSNSNGDNGGSNSNSGGGKDENGGSGGGSNDNGG